MNIYTLTTIRVTTMTACEHDTVVFRDEAEALAQYNQAVQSFCEEDTYFSDEIDTDDFHYRRICDDEGNEWVASLQKVTL